MTQARKTLISLDATPYYHCVSRCVRRAFLCGKDNTTGINYEHRRQWIEDLMLELAEIFAIDIAAYAVMSNHYHIVFCVNRDQAEAWTPLEVALAWHKLYNGTPLSQRFIKGEALDQGEQLALDEKIAEWRERLYSISHFMQRLNEGIARLSNAEDGCTGRFWEGRFKSQALLDDAALAACLAYVDLNPIRAGMHETPEDSDFTSIKRRINTIKNEEKTFTQPAELLDFVGNPRQDIPHGLHFKLEDYIQLVDWTGRILRKDKRGAINANLPPILDRLQIDPQHWLFLSQNFESRFKGIVGTAFSIKQKLSCFERERLPQSTICTH